MTSRHAVFAGRRAATTRCTAHIRFIAATRCLSATAGPVTSSTTGMKGKGPLAAYNELVATGELRPDERQARAMVPLQRLYDDLLGDPGGAAGTVSEAPGRGGFFTRWFGKAQPVAPAKPPPLGLYTWGGVGCGKTMLMDLFLDCVRADVGGLSGDNSTWQAFASVGYQFKPRWSAQAGDVCQRWRDGSRARGPQSADRRDDRPHLGRPDLLPLASAFIG